MPAILLLGFTLQAFPQTDPAAYYNRLFYLCKAWGHAKYYHSEIAKGTVAWDDQLLTAIAATKNAGSDAEFSAIVLTMLNSAGTMETSTVALPSVPADQNLNTDLAWIDNAIFSDPVKLILTDIKTKFRPQVNYYVGKMSTGNPDFTTDNLYAAESDYPSEEKRVLALFRYWNQVHYFYPYKPLMDQGWDATLQEFIAGMVESQDATSYMLKFRELTTHLHSNDFFTSPAYIQWNGQAYPPFNARFIEGEMVITRVLAGTTGLQAGDVIKQIDGQDSYTLRAELKKLAPGGTEICIERNLNDYILYGPEGASTIIVDHGSGPVTTDFERNMTNFEELKVSPEPAWKMQATAAGDNFGVVDINRLEVADVPAMFSDLWNTKALILDMRGKHLGTMWTVPNYLISAPVEVANLLMPDVTYPGTLYWRVGSGGTPTGDPYKGKVILLVNELTSGTNEWMCMIMSQLPDLTVIGTTTQGSDGNSSYQYLPGNIIPSMVGMGVFYPDNTPTQRIGIVPDIWIPATIDDYRNGMDAALNRALNSDLLNMHPGYCISAANATQEWISSVTLGSYTKTSGSSGFAGYEKFLDPAIPVESGKSYALALKPGFLKAVFENWAVYIDYNGDQGFDEPGELVFSKNKSKTLVSGTISIPAGLSITTRMRVIMSNGAITGPCTMMLTGEVEDYTLNIAAPAPDPLVANFSATPLTVSAGEQVQFTDLSTGSPTGWSWSFPGGTPATSVTKNPSVTYSQSGIYSATLTVTIPDATNSVTKTDYITVNPVALNYCTPISITSTSDYIKTVAIQGIFTNSTVGTRYAFYPDAGTLIAGSAYNVTLTPNNSTYRNYWKIWIDLNGDYDFNDTGECVLTVNNKKGAVTAAIAIPAGAAGPTRMRVSMRNGAAPMPCDDGFIGEVEDYGITLMSSGSPGSRITTRLLPGASPYSSLTLYPNPVSQELHIQLGTLAGNDILEIYSAEGKKMLRQPLLSTEVTLDVSRYTKGLYFIRIISDNESVTKRIIKE